MDRSWSYSQRSGQQFCYLADLVGDEFQFPMHIEAAFRANRRSDMTAWAGSSNSVRRSAVHGANMVATSIGRRPKTEQWTTAIVTNCDDLGQMRDFSANLRKAGEVTEANPNATELVTQKLPRSLYLDSICGGNGVEVAIPN